MTIESLILQIKNKLKSKGEFDVFLTRIEPDGYHLTIESEIGLDLDFNDTLFLSDLFKTTDISSSNFEFSGYDTFNYGELFGTEFTIKNIGIEIE